MSSSLTTRPRRRANSKNAEAYSRLKKLIESGELDNGAHLTEAKAANLLGMSRGPVRESILMLEAEGLLQRGKQRARVVTYVEDQDPEDMLMRAELREQIESAAARCAAKNMTGRQIERLRTLAQHVDEMQRESDHWTEEMIGPAEDYRQYLLNNCGNTLIIQVWTTFRLNPPRPRSEALEGQFRANMPDDVERTALSPIVDAIGIHDADRAEQLAKKRIRHITDALRKTVWENSESGLHAPGDQTISSVSR